jgi:hypothetical protein
MKNGEQGAFPKRADGAPQTGLTKREYFAGLAMQGMLANQNGGMTKGCNNTFSPIGISELALLHADALLEELEKTEEDEG